MCVVAMCGERKRNGYGGFVEKLTSIRFVSVSVCVYMRMAGWMVQFIEMNNNQL
jgi:hypothetical protein